MDDPPGGHALTADRGPLVPDGLDATLVLVRHGESTFIVEGRFQGQAETPLTDHAFNMKYLRALFGEGIAASLADKACLCVGTILGPRAEVSRLSRLILSLAATPRSEFGGAFGADQAGFNMAIHQGLVGASIRPNYGRVATLGLTPGEGLTFVDGKVVNPDGGFSPIVHQHDRHPHLDAPVHALWGGGLEHRKRVRPKSAGQKLEKLKASLRRRTPELR